MSLDFGGKNQIGRKSENNKYNFLNHDRIEEEVDNENTYENIDNNHNNSSILSNHPFTKINVKKNYEEELIKNDYKNNYSEKENRDEVENSTFFGILYKSFLNQILIFSFIMLFLCQYYLPFLYFNDSSEKNFKVYKSMEYLSIYHFFIFFSLPISLCIGFGKMISNLLRTKSYITLKNEFDKFCVVMVMFSLFLVIVLLMLIVPLQSLMINKKVVNSLIIILLILSVSLPIIYFNLANYFYIFIIDNSVYIPIISCSFGLIAQLIFLFVWKSNQDINAFSIGFSISLNNLFSLITLLVLKSDIKHTTDNYDGLYVMLYSVVKESFNILITFVILETLNFYALTNEIYFSNTKINTGICSVMFSFLVTIFFKPTLNIKSRSSYLDSLYNLTNDKIINFNYISAIICILIFLIIPFSVFVLINNEEVITIFNKSIVILEEFKYGKYFLLGNILVLSLNYILGEYYYLIPKFENNKFIIEIIRLIIVNCLAVIFLYAVKLKNISNAIMVSLLITESLFVLLFFVVNSLIFSGCINDKTIKIT